MLWAWVQLYLFCSKWSRADKAKRGTHSHRALGTVSNPWRSPSSTQFPVSRSWVGALYFVLPHLHQLRKHWTFQSPIKSCRPYLYISPYCPPWGNKRWLPPLAWAPGNAQSFIYQNVSAKNSPCQLEWYQPALSMFPWSEVTMPQRNNHAYNHTSLYSV